MWTMIYNFMKDVAVPILTFVVLPAYLWFARDRRKSRAETAVVERTVDSDVTVKEAGGLGASVAFVQEAFRMERESYQSQIKDLKEKVTRLEEQHEEDMKTIRSMAERIERLENKS